MRWLASQTASTTRARRRSATAARACHSACINCRERAAGSRQTEATALARPVGAKSAAQRTAILARRVPEVGMTAVWQARLSCARWTAGAAPRSLDRSALKTWRMSRPSSTADLADPSRLLAADTGASRADDAVPEARRAESFRQRPQMRCHNTHSSSIRSLGYNWRLTGLMRLLDCNRCFTTDFRWRHCRSSVTMNRVKGLTSGHSQPWGFFSWLVHESINRSPLAWKTLTASISNWTPGDH